MNNQPVSWINRRADSRSNPPSVLQPSIILLNGETGATKWWIVASLQIYPANLPAAIVN